MKGTDCNDKMTGISFYLEEGIYPPKVGGMEIFNCSLAREMAGKADLTCLATEPVRGADGSRFYRMFRLRPRQIFYPLQLIVYFLFHPRRRNLLFSYSSETPATCRMLTFAIRRFKLRAVVVIHFGKAPSEAGREVVGALFKSCAKVVAVSEDIKKNYDSFYGISCEVIPPLVPFAVSPMGVRDCRAKYSVPVDSSVICMVGSFRDLKNTDTVVRAIASMSPAELEKYNPCVVYAGDGQMRESVRNLAEELGVSDRVVFLGNVPRESVNEVFRMSDIYLMASDYEGTSISLLEAMFNSKPIIASRAPGVVDMLDEDKEALMFTTRSSDELGRLIVSLLSDAELMERISAAARRRYDMCYDYGQMLSRYLEMFD